MNFYSKVSFMLLLLQQPKMWLTVTKQDTVQILRFELARVNSKAVQ